MAGKVTRSVQERLRAYSAIHPETGCWEWQGYCNPNGYPRIGVRRVTLYAHRVSYEAFVGPIPADLQIDHLCRNKACVNPEHLEPVTRLENCRRGIHATKTRCVNGHEFTPENTLLERGKWRRCKTCRNARRQRAYVVGKLGEGAMSRLFGV